MKSQRKKNQVGSIEKCESEVRRDWVAFVQNAKAEGQALRNRASRGFGLGWKLELPRGREIPFGYGLGWVDMSRWVAVCFLWPLNLIARWWRSGDWRLRHIGRAIAGPGIDAQFVAESQRLFREEQSFAEQYAAGYLAGWEECFDACLEAVHEELGTPHSLRRPAPKRASRATSRSPRIDAGNSSCAMAEAAEDTDPDVQPKIDRLKVN